LSDIVKRGSIRKSRRGASRGRSTSNALLDRTRLGSISKQFLSMLTRGQRSEVGDQMSENSDIRHLTSDIWDGH